MNTQILEHYSNLCDEIENFMHAENTDLRCNGSDGTEWVERKKNIIEQISSLLGEIRKDSLTDVLHPGPIAELRNLVMKKLLKLLLLSRENEQLLLKNTMSTCLTPSRAISASTVRSAYLAA